MRILDQIHPLRLCDVHLKDEWKKLWTIWSALSKRCEECGDDATRKVLVTVPGYSGLEKAFYCEDDAPPSSSAIGWVESDETERWRGFEWALWHRMREVRWESRRRGIKAKKLPKLPAQRNVWRPRPLEDQEQILLNKVREKGCGCEAMEEQDNEM